MIVDWDWWVLLLLLLIFLMLLLLYRLLRGGMSKPPVVLFDGFGRPINVDCGHSDALYTNGIGPMDVNVELENIGQCTVTLSTPTRTGFLERDGMLNRKGAAAIRLGNSEAIAYACKTDMAQDARCEFRIKITRI